MREAKDELPETELLGGQTPTLMAFDPVAQGRVSDLAAQPLDRIPGTRCEDAADDEVPVPVQAQPAGVEIPEELGELGGESRISLALLPALHWRLPRHPCELIKNLEPASDESRA